MNLQPTLEGDLVLLRPLADTDYDQLFEAAENYLFRDLYWDHKVETHKLFGRLGHSLPWLENYLVTGRHKNRHTSLPCSHWGQRFR